MDSESIPQTSNTGSISGNGKTRKRYRRRRHKRTFSQKFRRGISKFFRKYRVWILGILSLLLLIVVLLIVFAEIEHKALNEFAQPAFYE